MARMNRDVYAAIFLLVFTGVMFWASFDIREPDYGVLPPSVWPRVILGVLGLLSFVFLVHALRQDPDAIERADGEPTTLGGWIAYWRNPIVCFILFTGYLTLIPLIGMLSAGILFVFSLLTALGGWQPRQLFLHACIAGVAVGGMWSIFTFGLNVLLPTGEWTGF